MQDDYHRATKLNIEHRDVDRLAFIAYTALRAWNRSHGDFTNQEWSFASPSEKTTIRQAVLTVLEEACLEGVPELLTREDALLRGIVTALDPRRHPLCEQSTE